MIRELNDIRSELLDIEQRLERLYSRVKEITIPLHLHYGLTRGIRQLVSNPGDPVDLVTLIRAVELELWNAEDK